MRIERHIFGSYSGYTTLGRSAGISTEDCRLLESGAYGFGQCNDRHFTRSLTKNPAWFTRALNGGRRGLTRVLEGNPDDSNRPTLCLMTLVVLQRDWDSVLWGDVSLLLDQQELWSWDGQPSPPSLEIEPPPPSRSVPRRSVPRLLALLSEVERGFAARRSIIVSGDDYGPAEMRALEMLVPPAVRRSVTTGCRSLSPRLPVMVNGLSSEVDGQGPVFRFQNGAAVLSPYAVFLQSGELSSGVIPLEEVAQYRGFGAADSHPLTPARAAAAAGPVTVAQPAPRWPLAALAGAGLALAAGMFLYGRSGGASLGEQRTRAALAQVHAAELEQRLAAQAAAFERRLADSLGLPRDAMDTTIEMVKGKLAAAQAAADAAPKDAAAAQQARTERDRLRAFHDAELKRQKERFERVKPEVEAMLREMNGRRLMEEAGTITRLHAELLALREDWPLAGEGDGKFGHQLRQARAQLGELAAVAARLILLRDLLERLELRAEECRRQGDARAMREAMGELRLDLQDLLAALPSVPERLEQSGVDLGPYRKTMRERTERIRKWLDERDRPPAATRPSKPPQGVRNDRPLERKR